MQMSPAPGSARQPALLPREPEPSADSFPPSGLRSSQHLSPGTRMAHPGQGWGSAASSGQGERSGLDLALAAPGLGSLTFFFSDKSFHMRARRRVSSLSESSGRSSCSCRRFSSEKMNMADTGRLGFSEPPCR